MFQCAVFFCWPRRSAQSPARSRYRYRTRIAQTLLDCTRADRPTRVFDAHARACKNKEPRRFAALSLSPPLASRIRPHTHTRTPNQPTNTTTQTQSFPNTPTKRQDGASRLDGARVCAVGDRRSCAEQTASTCLPQAGTCLPLAIRGPSAPAWGRASRATVIPPPVLQTSVADGTAHALRPQ